MVKKITKGKVYEFVKEALVIGNDKKMACGDGRYNPEQSEGAIRAFGADFGMIMAFAGALKDERTYLDPSEIVERYARAKEAVFGEKIALDYHTDSHGGIGCGHIAKASDPNHYGLYGKLTHTDVVGLYNAFCEHPNSNLTVLEGHHEEKGVLHVRSDSDSHGVRYSVHSRNKKGDMYFVVDGERINRFIDLITPPFSSGLLEPVSAADVKRNYATQMEATAKLLGADKLDHYEISVNEAGHFTMEQLPQKKQTRTNSN